MLLECRAVDSGDREPGTERSRGVGRRGGWRGRGVGVPGTSEVVSEIARGPKLHPPGKMDR